MRFRAALTACVVLMLAGCGWQSPDAGYWWEVPWTDHPPKLAAADQPAVYGQHPRLMFRPTNDVGLGRPFDRPRQLYREDATFKQLYDQALATPIERQNPAMLAAAWIVTGEDKYAEASVQRMLSEPLSTSHEPSYSNMFIHALAYDWLFHHPALTAERKKAIVAKIVQRLGTELDNLDDQEMDIWHGRNQAANGAIITALAIADLPGNEKYLRRAAAHYASVLKALQYSEAWPEGTSYWIYNRAVPFAMAADCFLTATGSDRIAGLPIREIIKKIGYWQIYQFAPNGTFEPYGDSAGSLHLGETGWWEVSADHFAKVSGDPGLMAGADYFRNRSPSPYGRRQGKWCVAYSYEPSGRPKDADYDPAKPELWMRKHLPQAMLFGRRSWGVAFFRGNWGDPDETYATFKAGDLLAHHDHYDTGHFGIQRGGDLTPRTGKYGLYTGAHRLGYYVQTVSANSLLVMAPGEFSSYLRTKYPQSWQALSGGQRVIRPTSFHCISLEHFKKQLNYGPHLERGDITAFQSEPDRFDYIAADITAAYNSTRWAEPGNPAKVSLVTRQFLYLRPEQAFVVYDRVEATDAKFLPKFLLHSWSKPQTDSERLLAERKLPTTQMAAESGIYETADRKIVTTKDRGRLTQLILLPQRTRTLKIGGPEYCYYVQDNGDESAGFNGRNVVEGAVHKSEARSYVDQWRVEVEPAGGGKSTRFLNVLLPRLKDDAAPLPTVKMIEAGPAAHAVQVGQTLVVVAHDAAPLTRLAMRVPAGLHGLILDAKPFGGYTLNGQPIVASKEGVIEIEKTTDKLELVGR